MMDLLVSFELIPSELPRGNRWCGGRIGLTPSVRQCRDVERAEEGSKPAPGQAADDDRWGCEVGLQVDVHEPCF